MIFIIVFGFVCFLVLFAQMFLAALYDHNSRTSRVEKIFYLALIAIGIAILASIIM